MDENKSEKIYKKVWNWISTRVFNHQVGVFLIFVAISTILWFVTSLNEEIQRQVTCRVVVTNVPDTVTFISTPPTSVAATVRCKGTHLLRQFLGEEPTIRIDFRSYSHNNRLSLSKSNMFELVQSDLGDGRQVMAMYPDSIGLYYTSYPPFKVPIKVMVTATASPNMHIFGPVASTTDSVLIYSVNPNEHRRKAVPTVDVHFPDVSHNTTLRVPLVVPPGCRAVPDSVNVKINVEPYVTETRWLDVEAINAPDDVEITFTPAKVKTSYRVPQSRRLSLPAVRVVADYNSMQGDNNKVEVSTDPWVSYIFLETDSVSYFFNNAKND